MQVERLEKTVKSMEQLCKETNLQNLEFQEKIKYYQRTIKEYQLTIAQSTKSPEQRYVEPHGSKQNQAAVYNKFELQRLISYPTQTEAKSNCFKQMAKNIANCCYACDDQESSKSFSNLRLMAAREK